MQKERKIISSQKSFTNKYVIIFLVVLFAFKLTIGQSIQDSSKYCISLSVGIGKPNYNEYYSLQGFHFDIIANYDFGKHGSLLLYLGETINPFDNEKFMAYNPATTKVSGGTFYKGEYFLGDGYTARINRRFLWSIKAFLGILTAHQTTQNFTYQYNASITGIDIFNNITGIGLG